MKLLKLFLIEKQLLNCLKINGITLSNYDKGTMAEVFLISKIDYITITPISSNSIEFVVNVEGQLLAEKLPESFYLRPNSSHRLGKDNIIVLKDLNLTYKTEKNRDNDEDVLSYESSFDFSAKLTIIDKLDTDANIIATNIEISSEEHI